MKKITIMMITAVLGTLLATMAYGAELIHSSVNDHDII